MNSSTYSVTVNLPDIEHFLKSYSRYTTLVSGEGRSLYDLIMQPEVFVRASVISEIGLPAVLAVAEDCKVATDSNRNLSLDSFTKQFIGSAICTLMEANGYKKTTTKKSVPHKSFSVGTYYKKA